MVWILHKVKTNQFIIIYNRCDKNSAWDYWYYVPWPIPIVSQVQTEWMDWTCTWTCTGSNSNHSGEGELTNFGWYDYCTIS